MSSQELSLSWEDHPNALVGVFQKLLDNSSFVDCTIAAEGQYVKAHKVILSACSPYFELLFNQESEKNPIIILKDVKFQELKAIIEFIYHGTVKVLESRLDDFVDAAESLQIRGLGIDLRRNSTRNNLKETQFLCRNEGSVSLISRKRRRSSSPNTSEEKADEISPEADSSFFNNRNESLLRQAIQKTVFNASSAKAMTFDSCNPTCSTFSFSSVVPSEKCSVETSEASSITKHSLSSEESEEIPPFIEPVIKIETVPDAETFTTEECVLEPKHEVHMQGFSSPDNEKRISAGINEVLYNKQRTNEYSTLHSLHLSLERGLNCSFPLAQITEHISSEASSPAAATPPAQSPGSSPRVSPRQPAAAPASAPAPPPPPPPPLQPRCVRHACHACGLQLATAAHLEAHVRSHAREPPFTCGECGATFALAADLLRHRRRHAGARASAAASAFAFADPAAAPFRCALCDVGFHCGAALLRHGAAVHAAPPAARSPGAPARGSPF